MKSASSQIWRRSSEGSRANLWNVGGEGFDNVGMKTEMGYRADGGGDT